MLAIDRGTKHVCFKCGAKFYDMKKPDPSCPKCGSDPREAPAFRPRDESRRNRLVGRLAPEPEDTELVDEVDTLAAEEPAEDDDYLEEDEG